jgi:hypothetical protein
MLGVIHIDAMPMPYRHVNAVLYRITTTHQPTMQFLQLREKRKADMQAVRPTPQHIASRRITPQHTAPHRTTPHRCTPHHITPQFTALHRITVDRSTVHHTTVNRTNTNTDTTRGRSKPPASAAQPC